MSSRVIGQSRPPIAAPHLRTDPWWALPITVVIVLGSFLIYSTWAAFQNAHYFAAPYLSPFYSPCLYRSCLHPSFGFGLPEAGEGLAALKEKRAPEFRAVEDARRRDL